MKSRNIAITVVAAATAVLTTLWPAQHAGVQAQAPKAGGDFAAVPGTIGGQDI
jgi:hypothetical protein